MQYRPDRGPIIVLNIHKAMFNLLSSFISTTISLLVGVSNVSVSTTPKPLEYEDVSVVKHWSDDYIPVYEIRAAKGAAFEAAYEEVLYDTLECVSIPTPPRQEACSQKRAQAHKDVLSSYDQFPVTKHLNTGCYGALEVHDGLIQKRDKKGHAVLLEREYAVLSALQGTGLVPGQVSFSDGVLSMEYIHAASLDYYHRSMEAGIVDYIQYTCILDAVATAVKAFHSAGWVHNDLHPGNILITLKEGEWHAILIDVAFSTSEGYAFPQKLGLSLFRSGWESFEMSQEADIDSLKRHIKVPYLDKIFSR